MIASLPEIFMQTQNLSNEVITQIAFSYNSSSMIYSNYRSSESCYILIFLHIVDHCYTCILVFDFDFDFFVFLSG